ncbi:tripartite tricarboxylate transporter permease [Desulfosudis oleivorans]|nr:tripartite tricarboxylate transporter permease [Desulfosudis oleivorans]
MIEQVVAATHLIATPATLSVMLLGIVLGVFFGIMPGIGGLTALALLLPFIYDMNPATGLCFLVATHAAVDAGGVVTSIMLGIPGSPANAAVIEDGFALRREGRGLYAVGAALTASVAGGLFSAALLVVLLPVLQTVVLSFGSPEIFLIVLTGLTYVAVLGRGSTLKAFVAVALGVFLSSIGYQRITGEPRLWFGVEYLLDGVRLIPLVLGLFAVPEILNLFASKKRIDDTDNRRESIFQMWAGAREVFKRPLLLVKSSVIGMVVGIIPGVGGETAPFLAYASAKKSSNERIVGVIAPESSNNAKEGGALVPTLALGIPGSAGMAILMSGFLILGINPGPKFINQHMDIALGLVFTLAITNVVSALVVIPLAAYVAKIIRIQAVILAPALSALVIFGTYASSHNPYDVAALFACGLLGIGMQRFSFSRPILILSFILAPIIETYLHISIQAYGLGMFARPIFLVLLVVLVLSGIGLKKK